MLTVKVLGSGCENCKKVEGIARRIISSMGMEANVVKVTDWAEIKKYPILGTPGLVIPSEAEVTTWLVNAEMEQA
jgi:hypothetical protein